MNEATVDVAIDAALRHLILRSEKLTFNAWLFTLLTRIPGMKRKRGL